MPSAFSVARIHNHEEIVIAGSSNGAFQATRDNLPENRPCGRDCVTLAGYRQRGCGFAEHGDFHRYNSCVQYLRDDDAQKTICCANTGREETRAKKAPVHFHSPSGAALMVKDEAEEVDELHALFGHTTVPRGMFLKYQVAAQNREIADRARIEKEQRDQLLEERRVEQHERIQRLRNKTKDLDREAVARLHEKNRRNAEEVKAAEQKWERSIMQQKTELKREVHARGSADFHNARLAEQEAELDRKKREKATRDHQAYLKRMRDTHNARMQARTANARKVHEEVENANFGSQAKAKAMRGKLANEAKEAKRAWKEQLERNEQARLEQARANRKHAEDVRERARKAKEKQTNTRQTEGARMQRQVDADAHKAKTELMNYKKRLRQERYAQRYANKTEAELLEKSTFRRLYGLGANEPGS